VNETRTIEQLEQALHQGTREALPGPVLDEIRSRGRARRRNRLAAYAGGAAAGIVAAGLLVGVVSDDGTEARDRAPLASRPTPTELSPLAKRVLREVPGAVQVSEWEVLIPGPDAAHDFGTQVVPEDLVDGGPVDLGTRHYVGVTSFRPGAFPAWLYQGVQDIEQHELAEDDGSYPVGSTDMGVVVDAGPLELACIQSLPEWGEGAGDGCHPAMLGTVRGQLTYAWGMGTDDFLQEGEDLELFSTRDLTAGTERTVWIGGTDGTEVATVTLVTTDGTRVDGTVASGTVVPGETMFWGTVAGELAVAITRDANGEVLERHELEPCSDPVDCEVR
jgi:hypothetical protein